MSANANDGRIKQIEEDLAEKRALLKTLDESLRSLLEGGDQDIIVDIAHTPKRENRELKGRYANWKKNCAHYRVNDTQIVSYLISCRESALCLDPASTVRSTTARGGKLTMRDMLIPLQAAAPEDRL